MVNGRYGTSTCPSGHIMKPDMSSHRIKDVDGRCCAAMDRSDRILYDKDIREPLFFFLEETYGKVRILEEKRTGSARADVVMITPQFLYGIEIKSDADSYTRLKKQVKNYDWYYDRNIIVIGSTHAAHVREHVPDTWGIISVELDEKGMVDFYVIRGLRIILRSKIRGRLPYYGGRSSTGFWKGTGCQSI